MSEASVRDLVGSRDSLRAAIGRLDTAAPTSRAAPRAVATQRPVPSRFGSRWAFLAGLIVLSAAAVVSLLML